MISTSSSPNNHRTSAMRWSVAALLLLPLAAASREEAAAPAAVPRRLPRASAAGAFADPAPSPHRSGVPMSTYDPANILDDDCSTAFEHVYDSGFVGTAGASHDVAHVGAESLQLDLGKSVLAGDARVRRVSFLVRGGRPVCGAGNPHLPPLLLLLPSLRSPSPLTPAHPQRR